jgi:hypothetical protein
MAWTGPVARGPSALLALGAESTRVLRPLVKPTLALETAKAAVPQLRLIRALGRGRRLAIGTPHLTPPFGEVSVHREPEETKMARKLTEPLFQRGRNVFTFVIYYRHLSVDNGARGFL